MKNNFRWKRFILHMSFNSTIKKKENFSILLWISMTFSWKKYTAKKQTPEIQTSEIRIPEIQIPEIQIPEI